MSDAAPWLAHASDITSMTFAETVSLSGNYTLYFNQNSDSVTPSTLEESIYTELTNIYLYADTSGIERMSGMFARLPKLENVYIKAGDVFDTGNVVDISAIFYGDEKLTCIDTATLHSVINHFSDTSNVTDARYAFFADKCLEKPQIGHWNVSAIKDMSYMLTGCLNAKITCGLDNSGSDLRNWRPTSAYSTVCMFAGPTIDLTQSNPINNLWGNTSAKVVDGDFDLSLWGEMPNLEVAVYMFAQNSALTSFSWSQSSAPSLEDVSCMLAWNSALEDVNLSSLDTPSLKHAVCMLFNSGVEDAQADFSNWNLSLLEDARYFCYGTGFNIINLNGTNPKHLSYATGMFSNNEQLESFGTDALGSWELLELTDGSYMFHANSKLSTLDASNFGLDSVEDLSYFIADNTSLTDLDTSSWNISPLLKNLSFFSYNCNKILLLDMGNWDVSGVKEAPFAFANMSALENVVLIGWNFTSLENAYGLFANTSHCEV